MLLSICLLLGIGYGCGDDSGTGGRGGDDGSGGRSDTGGGGGGTTKTTSTTGSMSTTSSSSSSSSTGGGGDGGGGGTQGDSGHASTEFVNSGEVCESQGYRLVYTLGQPTTNQETMTSTGYRLQGGFVGATGSLQ
ncbi:MAG: hypothetical protein HOV80_02800 [Polyangiaceae bacterium]|nr:hypothetical protein [Polyangiaceae bacterium]